MYSGVAVLHNKLYIAGGAGSWQTRKSLKYKDMETGRWSQVKDMHLARYGHGMVSVNDKLYAIGGHAVNTVEVYDPNTNKWRTLQQKLDGKVSNTGAGVMMKYYLESS